MSDEGWMTAEAAAARLGVKTETLYAYVSRGVIGSEPVPGTRRSRFLRADVERKAARRRGGGRAGALEIIVETDLTMLEADGRLSYRGWSVADAIAEGAGYEEIAGWLWHGERGGPAFVAPDALTAAARDVLAPLAAQPVMDQIRAAVAAMRHADPLRDDRRPEAVAFTARGLVAALLAALPRVDGAAPAPSTSTVARRLWPVLTARRADARSVELLDAALVLLADHELAASTLAARVTASTWADPYLVVLAGLATLGGPLHGGASAQARDLLREVTAGRSRAAEAIGARLRDGQLVPGFGHRIYDERDPRCDVLLGLLRDRGIVLDAEDELVAVMQERGLPFPNIDFAVASLAERHDMVEDAGQVVFAVARTVGWLAHAAEEYRHRLRFRSRAVYTGPRS